jgi:hypothetical protein
MSCRLSSIAAPYGVLALLAASVVAAGENLGAEPKPVQAVWKPQQITFTYESFTTFYSCSSLETKVERVLTALGAAAVSKVQARGCFERNTIPRMPIVEITLVSPVEATPEALAEQEKTRSVRELTARVRGDSKLAAEAAAQFPAQWQRLSLSRGALRLEPGDCELIVQLKRKVLPLLAVRVVEDAVKCSPNSLNPNQPRLVIEALVPMPKPDASPERSP